MTPAEFVGSIATPLAQLLGFAAVVLLGFALMREI